MTSITTPEVQRASVELDRMRGSLSSWLKYRSINDRVLAGTLRTKKPIAYAQQVVSANRDLSAEQDLASKLHALLSVVMRGQDLPNADLRSNPQGAVQLAQVALMGGSSVAGPVATGGLFSALTSGHPWMWPALIVGGLLLVVVTAIKTAADVAKDREEKACIQAGACTDYGFWLKAGGVAVLAWFAWERFGGKELLSKKGRS